MQNTEPHNNERSAPPIAIVKIGDTFPSIRERFGDFENWIQCGLGNLEANVIVVDPRKEAAIPQPHSFSGVIVSGSHSMLTEEQDWMRKLAAWLRQAVAQRVPLLGICFGHQILAHALQGTVAERVDGAEIGTVEVKLTNAAKDDPLFCNLELAFPAHVVHWQSVVKLPPKAVVLARSQLEPNQAVRFDEHAWGVQFHPEMKAAVMDEYLKAIGGSTNSIIHKDDMPFHLAQAAEIILRNFMEYSSNRRPPDEPRFERAQRK